MKTEPTSQPIDLEKAILGTVRESIGKAIETALTGYSSPLQKLVERVVASREGEITVILTEAIDGGIAADFRGAMKQAIAHKLAKVLVGKMEGEIEKRANDIRSNPEMRAKIVVAISEAIKSVGEPAK